MKVYLMTTNWSGWEDHESNGCDVDVFDSREKAIRRMNEAVKRKIEEEKEYGREFHESARFEDCVTIVSQYSEYIEFDVTEKEVM